MITKFNYFLHSKGQFNLLPAAVADVLCQSYTIEKDGENCKTTHSNIFFTKLGVFYPDYISCDNKNSISVYWISENAQMLIRLSNHWSSVPVELKENLKVCKWIKHCRWTLEGNEQNIIENQGRNLVAGIIKFQYMIEI